MDTLFCGRDHCFYACGVLLSQHLRSEYTVSNLRLLTTVKCVLSYLWIVVALLWKIIRFLLVTLNQCFCHSDLWNKHAAENIYYTCFWNMVDINNSFLLLCDASSLDYQIPLFPDVLPFFLSWLIDLGSYYLMVHCDVPEEQSSATVLWKSQVLHDGYCFKFGNSVFEYSSCITDC
jgi:hypothetical protein